MSSLTAFMPKVIEQQFSYTASMVSLVLGVVVVPGALLGNFVGMYCMYYSPILPSTNNWPFLMR